MIESQPCGKRDREACRSLGCKKYEKRKILSGMKKILLKSAPVSFDMNLRINYEPNHMHATDKVSRKFFELQSLSPSSKYDHDRYSVSETILLL